MSILEFARRLALGVALCGLFLSAELCASAATVTGITGTVHSAAGAPVPGATVTARGPAVASTTTTEAGAFALAVPPGVYQVIVAKPGYVTVSTPDVVVLAGQSVSLTATIAEQNLSTLREIGRVSVSGRGVTLNTGAANQDVISGAEFAQLGDPQVNDVLQRIPDVVVEQLGTQKDTAIVVGGLQPYETQVLIDGHPIALGQYGVWLSQYFPSYLIGSVETQSGPGNTTPFADIAVGGTANLQTIGFTKKQTAAFTIGTDNWGSQYTDASVTGSRGKLDYVAALGTEGENGYYFGKNECDVFTTDQTTMVNTSDSAGLVAFCGSFNGSLYTRGQLYKLRYDFTPTTSFDVGFLGSYGGYSPQGSAWGASDGPTLVEQCIPYPYGPGGVPECTNPADANLIGKTINGFYWFPGTEIWNTQELWDGQFRTTLGSTTLLIRPYLGSIQPETYNGTGEGGYPAFFGPPPGSPGYQPPSLAPGEQIPSTGLPNPNTFESVDCPPGTVYSYDQINSPSNTITSTDGQEECYQYPYKTYEIDKLYGSTFSLVRPIGKASDFLDFTYDFHGQSTFAYANAPTNVQV
ncbi:MAG TPA: TonB-dependent receptor, partial [Candidatus Acidoferrales bacterium]|nr:TonB-dependent receptor [Candidatus Acidoferrales bacterium]